MRTIILQPPVARRRDGRLEISCPFDDGRQLIASISADKALLNAIRERAEPFVPIAVLVAASEGKHLIVPDEADGTFLANLHLGFVPLIERLYGLKPMSIEKESRSSTPATSWLKRDVLSAGRRASSSLGLMFSAGIDSFYSLLRLQQIGTGVDYFVNVNAGAHDDNKTCWEKRYRRVKEIGEKIRVPTITIDSNFHELVTMPHIMSHTIRNICAAYTLNGLVHTIVYSSSDSFQSISFSTAKRVDISYIEHTIASSFAWPRMSVVHAGWDASRVEKTRAVGSFPLSYRCLDVCTDQTYQGNAPDGPVNCGMCAKCVRTILTLEWLSLIDRYRDQFDMDNYVRHRDRLIEYIKNDPHPLNAEVARLLPA